MQRFSPHAAIGPNGDPDRDDQSAATEPDPSEADDDVRTVLARVGAELATLHAMVIRLQDSLGPTLAEAASNEGILQAGQELDLVAQTLDGLSTFLCEVDPSDPRSGRLDVPEVTAQIKLDGLLSRLTGRSLPKPLENRHGDLELF